MVRRLIVTVALAGALPLGVALPAFADQACYTGCAPGPVPGSTIDVPSPGEPVSPAPGPVSPRQATPSSGGLPFTGTDVVQSAGFASVLVAAGGALVRIGRRRARRAADPPTGA